MDAVDIKNRLSSEAFVCLHILETCFQISTLDIENSEICYYIFETIPEHRSYGVIRKFSSLEEAAKHYESLLRDNPDPIYVMKPDGPLYRKNVEGDMYMVRYSRVFETLEHWEINFQHKNRSDVDLYRMFRKVGPALAYRYEQTDSIGNIFKDTVITDNGQVVFWNWATGSKQFKKEIRQLRYFVKEMKKLATNPDRFNEFEQFLSTNVMQNSAPRKELIIWLFHYPLFMTEQGGVRFLEALNKITCDHRTGVKKTVEFKDALRCFNNYWKNVVTASSDDALKAVLNYKGAKHYDDGGHDLPRFAHNCVKHYSHNAERLGTKELTQIEVVDMLNTKYFKNFLETSFQALYRSLEALDGPASPAPHYNSKQVLDMLIGGKSL